MPVEDVDPHAVLSSLFHHLGILDLPFVTHCLESEPSPVFVDSPSPSSSLGAGGLDFTLSAELSFHQDPYAGK